jgi:N-acetylneuraminic acid mutarotase
MKIAAFFVMVILSVSAAAQNWQQKTNFPECRADGVSFVINDKIYYGTGIECLGSENNRFWVFDPATNIWDTIAPMPGSARRIAAGFSIGGKGYVGLGISPAGLGLNDLWEYDPALNAWSQKANFPGAGRGACVAPTTATKAYVGLGLAYMQFFVDFYEYDPVTDQWTPKAFFPGGFRTWASSFAIGNMCYVGCGTDNNNVEYSDFWLYDTQLNQWTQKAAVPGSGRYQASAFAINGIGYIGYGYTSNTDFYSYDPTTNSWTPEPSCSTTPITFDVSCATSTAGYCIIFPWNTEETWEFIPTLTSTAPEIANSPLRVYPNPSAGTFTVETKGGNNNELQVFDLSGKLVHTEIVNGISHVQLLLQPGQYMVCLKGESGAIARQRIAVLQ